MYQQLDYKNFDSVPHDWIIETLKIKFLRKTMNNWKTLLHLNKKDGQIRTDYFSISTGIFHEDNPSDLLAVRLLAIKHKQHFI